MKYMGSKNRIAKYILPLMLEHRKEGQYWVEPFVGGANIIDKVEGNRIGSDSNKYLIAFFRALQKGWEPPLNIDSKLYIEVKDNKEDYPPELVGCIGFCFTYGAKYFRGFIGNSKDIVCKNRDRIGESYRAVEKARKQCKDIIFENFSYDLLNLPPNSLIYCDPPYEGTEKYKDNFNHAEFWPWCRDKAKEGHTVFVSEYNAPDDFKCIWSREIVSSLTKNTGSKKGIEKLFTHKTQEDKAITEARKGL